MEDNQPPQYIGNSPVHVSGHRTRKNTVHIASLPRSGLLLSDPLHRLSGDTWVGANNPTKPSLITLTHAWSAPASLVHSSVHSSAAGTLFLTERNVHVPGFGPSPSTPEAHSVHPHGPSPSSSLIARKQRAWLKSVDELTMEDIVLGGWDLREVLRRREENANARLDWEHQGELPGCDWVLYGPNSADGKTGSDEGDAYVLSGGREPSKLFDAQSHHHGREKSAAERSEEDKLAVPEAVTKAEDDSVPKQSEPVVTPHLGIARNTRRCQEWAEHVAQCTLGQAHQTHSSCVESESEGCPSGAADDAAH